MCTTMTGTEMAFVLKAPLSVDVITEKNVLSPGFGLNLFGWNENTWLSFLSVGWFSSLEVSRLLPLSLGTATPS